MLVLSRKTDEKVVIGDNIVVTIVEVKGDNVKIGIEAPRSIKIYRAEIFEAVEKANIEAAKGTALDLTALEKKIKPKK